MASEFEVDKLCLGPLSVVYPHHFKNAGISTDAARKIYQRVLADVDAHLLEAATLQWLSTAHPFHPSPGELRDLALRLIEQGDSSADDAWTEVMNALRYIGSWGVPNWSNDTITKTMEAFGRWKDFCLVETDQLPIIRAQFLRIYEAQRVRRHDDRLMLPETRQKVDALIGQAVKRLEQPR